MENSEKLEGLLSTRMNEASVNMDSEVFERLVGEFARFGLKDKTEIPRHKEFFALLDKASE